MPASQSTLSELHKTRVIDAAQELLNATLQREVLEAAQVLPYRQSQDCLETASLLRDAPLVDQDTTRGGLVDPEHAEALMALALNATGLAAFARAHPLGFNRERLEQRGALLSVVLRGPEPVPRRPRD